MIVRIGIMLTQINVAVNRVGCPSSLILIILLNTLPSFGMEANTEDVSATSDQDWPVEKAKLIVFSIIFLGLVLCMIVYRKLLCIVIKTLPRDMRGLGRFAKVAIALRRAQRKNSTIAKIFDEVVRKHPDKVCFYFEEEKWTFKQVQELSARVANYFQSLGYKKGDPISLFMENRPEYVCIWLGLSRIGCVPALINANLRLESLQHSFKTINSKAIIYGKELEEALKEVIDIGELSGISLYCSGSKGELGINDSVKLDDALKDAPLTEPIGIEKIACNDPLYYIFTSGTTGLPKAAVIKHLRFMMAVNGGHYMQNIRCDDIQYSVMPLYHTASGMLGVGQPLCFGTSMVMRKKFSATNFWSDCIKYNVTVAQYIGEICRYLISQPPSPLDKEHKVRMMYGNGLRTEIWQSFVTRFGIAEIYEFYGSTEGNCNMINVDSRVGAVGFLPRLFSSLAPMRLIKVDEETGEPIRNPNTGLAYQCGPNEIGELVGKIVSNHPLRDFQGYADADTSSKQKKILTNVFSKGDSVFRSGDVLMMDEYGYFYFKDRTGDTFRWKGENVSTAEVESIISKICGLKDAVVYGVQITGVEGRAGMVAIADPEGSMDIDSLAEGISKALPTYARPLFLRTLNNIDLTGTYKMKKLDLQKQGFDVNKVTDPLYFFSGGKYIPLDISLYEQLQAGKIRL